MLNSACHLHRNWWLARVPVKYYNACKQPCNEISNKIKRNETHHVTVICVLICCSCSHCGHSCLYCCHCSHMHCSPCILIHHHCLHHGHSCLCCHYCSHMHCSCHSCWIGSKGHRVFCLLSYLHTATKPVRKSQLSNVSISIFH